MKVKEKDCIGNSIYESLILYTSGCVHTIRDNVLKDILSKNMAEVTDMLLTEFDEKAYIEGVKKQSYEEGEDDRRSKREGKRRGNRRSKRKDKRRGETSKVSSGAKEKRKSGRYSKGDG